MKIKENETLHEKLHDVSQQHDIIVRKLEKRLEVLEKDAGNHDKTIEESNARFNRIIERLQEDRTILEVSAIYLLLLFTLGSARRIICFIQCTQERKSCYGNIIFIC